MTPFPKSAVVSMVRNEVDIVPAWISHAAELFDFVIIADHSSTDGTQEYLENFSEGCPAMTLVRYRAPTFDQKDVIQALRAIVVEQTDADWLFILDSDEFLPFSSQSEFKARLKSLQSVAIPLFKWRNCYVAGSDGGNLQTFRQTRASALGKVALRRDVMANPLYTIPKGAHSLHHETLGRVAGSPSGELYHLPVRTLEQAWSKVLTGTLNRLKLVQKDPDTPNSRHYPTLLKCMLANPTWDAMPVLTHDYGESQEIDSKNISGQFEPFSFAQFAGITTDSMLLGDAMNASRASRLPIGTLVKVPYYRSLLEDIMTLDQNKTMGLPTELGLGDDGELRGHGDYGGRHFHALAEDAVAPITSDDLISALQAAFWEIRDPLPSAWGEHIPLLFSMFALLKPRCYVELGVHNGASFFAGCQSVESLQLDTTCVAVDSWLGDSHAGFHSQDVFDGFRKRINAKYSSFAGYIRSDFSAAVGNFDDGSIDLLHIDGFHSTAAVRHDFETWLPKLSKRGVVLFHDTNEFKSDFGVWKFWNSVRDAYPHLEFGHCHGLGVLIVGSASPLNEWLGPVHDPAVSRTTRDLLQVIYGGLGHLSWKFGLQSRSLKARESAIEELKSRMGSHDATLVELNRYKELERRSSGASAAGQVELERLARSLSEREQQVAELERRVAELAATAQHNLNAVRERDARLQVVQGKLTKVEASASWRMTALFRRVNGIGSMRRRRQERRKLAYQAETIASSGLFDKDWYLAQNRDVQEAGADPILHYLTNGADEGRDPSPWFDTKRYLAQNHDVAAAGLNPLVHFARASEDERRSRLPPDQSVPQPAVPQAAGAPTALTRPETAAATGK